jgi:hypothetical protein
MPEVLRAWSFKPRSFKPGFLKPGNASNVFPGSFSEMAG